MAFYDCAAVNIFERIANALISGRPGVLELTEGAYIKVDTADASRSTVLSKQQPMFFERVL